MSPRRTQANPPTPYAAAMTPKKEESERTDLSGRLVCNGSIRLVRILGEGGFGQVYEGRHIYQRHSIAVKVIARPQHPRMKEHLATELSLHEKMSYLPAIPTWIGYVNDLDYCYIMMEYCPLPSLAELMSKSKQPEGRTMGFDFEARRCIMMKVIEAVRACHSKRIYHRDIKPENILVDLKLLDIRLIDFGLAINQEVSKNCRTGTKEYMSPECYAEFNCHKKSTPFSSAANDVWSLGGRKLWLAPSIELEEDDRFARYVARPDTYFYSRYGLTREAQNLVSQVLCLNPNARMSLTDFGMTLAGLRCFFRNEEAIWSSSSKSNSITVSEMDFAGKSYKDGCMIRSSALNSAKDLIVTPDGLQPVQDKSKSRVSPQSARRRHRALSGLFGYGSQPEKGVIEENISVPHCTPSRILERSPQWLDNSSTSTDLELTPPSLLPATASSGLTFPPPSFDDGIFKPVIEFTLRSKNILKDRPMDGVPPLEFAQSTPTKRGPIILDTPVTSVLGLDSHSVQVHEMYVCPSPVIGEPHIGLEEAGVELSVSKKKRGRLFSSARLFGFGGMK